MDDRQLTELGTWSTAQPAGSLTGRRARFPGASGSLNLFKVILLLPGSLSGPRVFAVCLSETDTQQSLLLPLAGQGLVNPIPFRDFLKLFEIVYLATSVYLFL